VDEYIYKGFKLAYTTSNSADVYIAEGTFCNLSNNQPISATKKFHTEFNSALGAIEEIKKMFKNYIDFELKNYQQMKCENSAIKTPL
jgi:formylmethanofuran dehydrogenase subunit A